MRRAALLMAVLLVAAMAATASDEEWDRKSLEGLKGVEVFVEDLGPEAEADGLNKTTIRTDVELKLRQAGIKVLIEDQRLAAPGVPSLHIRAATFRGKEMPLYAYHLDVELTQLVRLERDLSIRTFAPTWSTGTLGTVGSANLSQIRNSIKDAVDRFVNAYLSVNPK